jgi:hypothetical protein
MCSNAQDTGTCRVQGKCTRRTCAAQHSLLDPSSAVASLSPLGLSPPQVRACDLKARTVVTLAGNGTKGRDYRGGRAGTAQARLGKRADAAVTKPEQQANPVRWDSSEREPC